MDINVPSNDVKYVGKNSVIYYVGGLTRVCGRTCITSLFKVMIHNKVNNDNVYLYKLIEFSILAI